MSVFVLAFRVYKYVRVTFPFVSLFQSQDYRPAMVYMTFVGVMKLTVVQRIYLVAVADGGMSAC